MRIHRGRIRLARLASVGIVAAFVIALLPTGVHASTLPGGFAETLIEGSLGNPTAMALAPDGRIFVADQGGDLWVIKNGDRLGTPFLHVDVDDNGERGLLGVTFHPDYPSTPFVYVYYTTATAPVHNRLSSFTVATPDADVADPNSEVPLLDLNNLSGATNHNGGAIHFGTDGKLYVAVGDNANSSNAQTLNNLLGKLLRLNDDGTIPDDNPYYNTAAGVNRSIWAIGLRNPFSFGVQPGTGRTFINDVGEQSFEEINDGFAAANYGWPSTEGYTSNPAYVTPLYAYGHGSGNTTGCAIVGGAFYNPATMQFPAAYAGDYFFADLCNRWIRVYDVASDTVAGFATSTASNLVDLLIDPAGHLYYLARGSGGQLWRVAYTASSAPSIAQHPANQTVTLGQPATFSIVANGTQPLNYQWQRNNVNISGANAASYTTPSTVAGDNGATFRCIVTNTSGNATSNAATLSITSNQLPNPTITSPANNSLYSAGQSISYAGGASDPETGTLPASALTWKVDFHHDTHSHPFIPDSVGSASGSFVVPTTGETATNVWYRIYLTARDPAGQTRTTFVDIRPRVVTLSFATSPAGLQIRLDGQPRTTPFTATSVVGMRRTLDVVSPQVRSSTTYTFASWSDGGTAQHIVATPTTNRTYTATYTAGGGGTTGNGLTARYYDTANFTSLKLTRTDATINFNWSTRGPASTIGADTFSVRWTGQVQAVFSQTYTFYAYSDNGVRVWINNVLVVNDWTSHSARERSGRINLVAGQKYAIQVDYYENTGSAAVRLSWSSPSQPKQIVPNNRLFR